MGFLRLALMTLVTFLLAFPAIALAAFDRGGRASSAIIAAWARALMRIAGVRVQLHHAERLPGEGSHVYVATHQSMLDIPALFTVLPARTRFVAKQELFRIPVFGQAIRLLGFIPIERRDARAAIDAINRAGDMARGASRPILVFPEGTRSRDGELLPFKKGAFALAHALKLPVVPLAVLGGAAALPPGSARVRPGTMVVRVGETLGPTGACHESRADLLAATREAIEALIAEGSTPAPEPTGSHRRAAG